MNKKILLKELPSRNICRYTIFKDKTRKKMRITHCYSMQNGSYREEYTPYFTVMLKDYLDQSESFETTFFETKRYYANTNAKEIAKEIQGEYEIQSKPYSRMPEGEYLGQLEFSFLKEFEDMEEEIEDIKEDPHFMSHVYALTEETKMAQGKMVTKIKYLHSDMGTVRRKMMELMKNNALFEAGVYYVDHKEGVAISDPRGEKEVCITYAITKQILCQPNN